MNHFEELEFILPAPSAAKLVGRITVNCLEVRLIEPPMELLDCCIGEPVTVVASLAATPQNNCRENGKEAADDNSSRLGTLPAWKRGRRALGLAAEYSCRSLTSIQRKEISAPY